MKSDALLRCQRSLFALDPDTIYLNCAYQSPLSHRVIDAGSRGLMSKGKPYEIEVSDFFSPLERLKEDFAKLIELDDPQRVAFHPSASYGFATIVNNLIPKKNGNIVMPGGQFPSNYYAFSTFAKKHGVTLRLIAPPDNFDGRGRRWNDQLLQAIDHDTICVTSDHSHWQDGTIFDLAAIRDKTRRCDALLIVDGTQSVGALPLSIKNLDPDALVCAGYKFLMGPFSCALTYFGSYFDGGNPIEFNWINREGSNDFSSLTAYQEEFRPKAYRYNVGECANFIQLPMLSAAVQQLLEWQVNRIQYYCETLTNRFFDLAARKGYKFEKELRGDHLFGLYKPEGLNVKALTDRLQQKKLYVSARGNMIRISPHVYNSEQDLLELAKELD
ncbi:MAG: aminotransferase class V-fold PLP-dependent enzyme [Saprospiraceae bacterium]|nr:aminotransferase class V-fold PLP-dependent enzyme [Saprospiraceae bacterium]